MKDICTCYKIHVLTMENKIPKKVTKYFRIVCALVTLALTCWCLVKLIKNEDVSLVGFVHFNDDENKPYPSLTICFWNPFLNDVLTTYGTGINTSTYSQFLQGQLWDDRMVNIDYDKVTVSLEDYLHEMGVQYGNFTTKTWSKDYNAIRQSKGVPSFHISNRDGGSKCYSFTLPFVQNVPVISFFARINKDIFPRGIRSPWPNFNGSDINGGGFTSFFHLPGQHYRSYFDKKYSWDDRTNKSKNYDMFYTIKNIEVLKHRNKHSVPCNEAWMKDDDVVMREIMDRNGCKPPHWKTNTTHRVCSSKEAMKKFKWPSYDALKSFLPPCMVIEKLQDDYKEMDVISSSKANEEGKEQKGWFRITLYFPETSYKEISQAQAYDIESFVGNAGGYLGLFLGYSLVCIPNWIVRMIMRTKKKYLEDGPDNLANENSNMIIDDFPGRKERVDPESLVDSNVPNEQLKYQPNQTKLELKVKNLEKKLDAIITKLSDNNEI